MRVATTTTDHDEGEDMVRLELARKLATLIRERNEMDKRLGNVIAAELDRIAVGRWVVHEVLGVELGQDGGPDRLPPDAAWAEGFGPEVVVAWAPADLVPGGARCLMVLHGSERTSEVSMWWIDKLELVDLDTGARLVLHETLPDSGFAGALEDAQHATLLQFSSSYQPKLSRYH